MKIFKKERLENGRRNIYFAGVRVFSYKKKLDQWQILYNRRFDENISFEDKKKIISHQFKYTHGYEPDLENPKTFNEK